MFRKLLITTAFRAIQRFLIERITFEPLQEYVKNLITPASYIADILTDSNPDDTAQLSEFWATNYGAIVKQDIELAKKIIAARVTDADIRELCLNLLDSIEGKDLGLTPPSVEPIV